MAGRGRGERCPRTGLARDCGDVGLGGWRVSCGRAPSGWEWNRSQPCQGATELKASAVADQGEAACRAGEPSGQGEEPSPKGLGGRDLLAQTDPRRPAGQVVGHHLYRQPSAVAAKRPDGMWFRPTPYLRGVLDLGVAAVVGLQFQGLSVPVGDEAVIAVGPKRAGNRAWASPAGR